MAILQAAVPLFLALVLLEYAAARRLGRRVHELRDAVTDLGCGVLAQVLGVGFGVLGVAAYAGVAAHASVQRLGAPAWPRTLAGWVVAFVLVDLGQYLMHRLSHRCELLWAAHAVHHSSEEMNLLVAMRSSSVQGLFNVVLALPLAALGLPWDMALACFGLNLLHQFWVHTRLVGRLGWLEAVFVTPSHHRVHHGRQAKYLDRNFGGVLIVWDRLFGTFQREEEEPDYGLVEPLGTWNPVWANLKPFGALARRWRAARGWRERVAAVLAPPEWVPARALPASPAEPRPVPARPLRWYAAAQLALFVPVAWLVLRRAGALGWEELAAFAFVTVVTLGHAGGLLDGARWARGGELARLGAIAGATVFTLAAGLSPARLALPVLAGSLLSLAWFLSVRDGRPEPAR